MSSRGGLIDETSLASLLSGYMEQRGLTQAELARRADLPRATMHRWLTGKSGRPYYRDGLLRCAAALGLRKVSTNRLLRAANLPPITKKSESHDPDESALLARWLTPAQNNLPADVTSFVGRADEITSIAEFLCQEHVRLVTLTGPGGSGKTRLSLRVADEVLDVFPDGIFFIPLASVSDPNLLMQTIADTIGLRDVLDISIQAHLTNWLRGRGVLLLLDNLEQLIDCGADIAGLLREAPELKILATSRVPLHVYGEHEWPVAPLPLPRSHGPNRQLRENPAVDLFLQRAWAANPRAMIDGEELGVVADICARLDGLPLAIELAAARMRDRSPAQLIADFPTGLELSSAGPRDVPKRHQTLRSTIAWSFDLLTSEAQRAMLCLTSFVGGWTLDAANRVCSAAVASSTSLQQVLATLVEANLVVHMPSSDRYQMLETIRAFGIERRTAARVDAAVRDRHAQYFLELAEAAPPYVPETRANTWFETIDHDLDNFRAALEWVSSRGHFDWLARFTSALWPYWLEYRRVNEGSRWVEMVLQQADDLPDDIHASVLTGGCTLATTHTDYRLGHQYGNAATELWRRLDNHRGQALITRQIGWVSYMSGDTEQAIELFTTSLEQWRLAGDQQGVTCAISDLGLALCIVGELDAAAPYLDEAKKRFQKVGDQHGMARSMRDRGLYALLRGNLSEAVPLLRGAVAYFRPIGKTYLLGSAYFYLGTALSFAGLLDEAIDSYAESLRLHNEIGDLAHVSLTYLGLAAVAYRRGDGVRAATLCGAAESLRRAHDMALPPAAASLYEREIANVLEQVDSDSFNDAFARGADMTDAEAMAFAWEGVRPH